MILRCRAIKSSSSERGRVKQDRLIIMMIQLMDRLLKRADSGPLPNTYAIIATSPTSGLVEGFVDGSFQYPRFYRSTMVLSCSSFKLLAPQKVRSTRYDRCHVHICSGCALCVIHICSGLEAGILITLCFARVSLFISTFGFMHFLRSGPKPLHKLRRRR
jgi:hypothetical protein